MNHLLFLLIRCIHRIYKYKTFLFLKNKCNGLYARWISLEFASCGSGYAFNSFLKLSHPECIYIGNNVYIGYHVVLEVYPQYREQKFNPQLHFGNNSSLGDHSHITCINKIVIGNNVRIGRKVFITDNAHGASDYRLLDIRPNLRPLVSKGPVIIEDNVWIGEMVCIMPGVTIGKGSIIGANTVITKDIPAYSVVVGNPGRIIKNMALQ